MSKNILLIGGSQGIGFEIASKLHTEHTQYDTTNDTLDIEQLPDCIDGFVFCPGSINLKPFKSLSIDDFREDIELNFLSMVKVVHQIINNCKNSDQASLIFFSTVAVKVGMPFHTSVAAAKGAIEGFAKALAAEYAPKLRVNVIAPSLTDTPLAKRLLSNDKKRLLSNDKKREMMDARHPLKRVGVAKDIASVASFLLSDESSWITGQVIGVDGGMSTLNIN